MTHIRLGMLAAVVGCRLLAAAEIQKIDAPSRSLTLKEVDLAQCDPNALLCLANDQTVIACGTLMDKALPKIKLTAVHSKALLREGTKVRIVRPEKEVPYSPVCGETFNPIHTASFTAAVGLEIGRNWFYPELELWARLWPQVELGIAVPYSTYSVLDHSVEGIGIQVSARYYFTRSSPGGGHLGIGFGALRLRVVSNDGTEQTAMGTFSELFAGWHFPVHPRFPFSVILTSGLKYVGISTPPGNLPFRYWLPFIAGNLAFRF